MSESLDFDDLDESGTGVGLELTAAIDIFGLSDLVTIPSSNISTDFSFATTLGFKPLSSDDVHLRLNGLWQKEGTGNDFSINISTKVITWLAGTGTGVDLAVSDEIIVYYRHKNVA